MKVITQKIKPIKYTLSILFLHYSIFSFAQKTEWIKHFTEPGNGVEITKVKQDNFGNMYAAGLLHGSSEQLIIKH